jgi:hypothetical protein
MALSSTTAYTFNGGELIISFNNNPNLLNMRNDYSVWGTRISASGATIPVHMRYAIDKKPVYYKAFDGRVFISNESDLSQLRSKDIIQVDWREIIYRMAVDYYKHNQEDDFIQ